MQLTDFSANIDYLESQLKEAGEQMLIAREQHDLSRFDFAVDSVLRASMKLNNAEPLEEHVAATQRKTWQRGTEELEFRQQTCFVGSVVAEMRAQIIDKARELDLLPKIDTKRINLWSGPRNVSTAIMRSFEQRSDTRVFDEPHYGAYLKIQHQRAQNHPMAHEVIGSMLCDGERVTEQLVMGPHTKPVVFFKQMTHHLYLTGIRQDFLKDTVNIILTRNPADVIPSLVKDIGTQIDINDTGYAAQVDLLETLQNFGQNPLVLDAELLLENPESVLTQLCQRIGIDFEPSMLSWEAGPSAFDGNWGKYWYGNVNKSRGFGNYQSRETPEYLQDLVDKCMPSYQRIREHAITPR
jgi:hypothetical protein